jgi:amidase
MKEYTLFELIDALASGKTTSQHLVQQYLKQIEMIDPRLHAVAELNPDALAIAKRMDLERLTHGPRSFLHGIPLLIKDNINTHDAMHTTANSLALADLIAPNDATIVTKLREAGAIILGKANLSEFAYFMSEDAMPSGYGSRNGQVVNPYNPAIDPLGSSTGSAVAVAANLICIAVGTETNGSLMAPAYMNSIVSIKPTFGLVSRQGIIPISVFQDTAGPMAKTVAECAVLLDVLAGSDPADPFTKTADRHHTDLASAWKRSVRGKRVGILTYSDYLYDAEELAILAEAKGKLEAQGLLVEPLSIETHPMENMASMLYEFKNGLNLYLATVAGHTAMKSLADILVFNREDPQRRMKYGQTILEASEKTSGDLSDPAYLAIREGLLQEANRLEMLMQEREFDALISTIWSSYAPIAGNPSICVPAKALTDLKPRAIVLIGKKWDDAGLIAIAHAYELATKHRVPPNIKP